MTQALSSKNGGYDPVHFKSTFAVEDRHFWFRARNEIISILARQIVSELKPGYRVLEMGCGDGNVLRCLESVCDKGSVTGMDLHEEALQYARRRTTCNLVLGDASRSPFGKTFHLIGIFDVLEHIPNDCSFLADLWRLLEPDGFLFMTVPAHAHLWSYFDEVSGHCRRYEKDELRSRLEQAGFRTEYLSEYMASIYPLMWLSRKLRSTKARNSTPVDVMANEVRVVPVVNGILSSLLSLESRWLAQRKHLPFGASLVVISRKTLAA